MQMTNDDIYVGSLDDTDELAALYGLSDERMARLKANCDLMGVDWKAVLSKVGTGIKRVAKGAKKLKKFGKKAKGKVKGLTAQAAQTPQEASAAPTSGPGIPKGILIAGIAAAVLFVMVSRKKGR
jgi:hypothetical protein